MLQDIYPHLFNIQYLLELDGTLKIPTPTDNDYVLVFDRETVLLYPSATEDGRYSITFPRICDISTAGDRLNLCYLFSIDEQRFFLSLTEKDDLPALPESGSFFPIGRLRMAEPMHQVFAALVGSHLFHWYDSNRLCGHCGHAMQHSSAERALACPNCHRVEYPRISPAVIVALTDGDKLLMTRYADRPYKQWALIAGFCEVGESIEDTVRREIREEVGLDVGNLRYYKSQPWPFSDSLLMGFFADVVGDTTPHCDAKELAEAQWFERAELPKNPDQMSLTQEMVRLFASGKEPV